MIVFSRPPGRRRRADDVRTSSSGADALRWPRKTTLRAALQALRTSSRGPCDGPPSRRTTLLAEEPARPSDVSPSYESKYSARSAWRCLRIGKGAQRRHGAKEPGLRWGKTASRMRRDACPMSHIALRAAPTRETVLPHQIDSYLPRTALGPCCRPKIAAIGGRIFTTETKRDRSPAARRQQPLPGWRDAPHRSSGSTAASPVAGVGRICRPAVNAGAVI